MNRKIWNKDIVINEIKELYRNGVALNSRSIRNTHQSLYDAARRHFGGLKDAIEAAGIDYSDIKLNRDWTIEKVVEKISGMYANGDNLRSSYVRKHCHGLCDAAVKYFETWEKAISYCGIDYDTIRFGRKWTKDLVVDEIKNLHKNGESIKSGYVQKKYPALQSAAFKIFGDWGNAVEAAGFDYDKVRRGRKWTKDLIIQEIKKLHNNGESLSSRNIQNSYPYIHGAAFKAFGSWGKAVEACGFEYTKIRKRIFWDKDMVVAEIKRIYDSCEGNLEILKSKFIKKNSTPLYGAAQRNFGNWGEAVKACGINYEEIVSFGRYTKEEKLEKVKKYKEKNRDRISEYSKQYYEKNKEKKKEYDKEYRIKNRDHRLVRGREYHFKNRDKLNEQKKQYFKENPHIAFNNSMQRCDLIGDEEITKDMWFDVMMSTSFKCRYCEIDLTTSNRSLDHIVPLTKKGAPADIDNLVPSCKSCNSSKRERLLKDWKKSLENFIESGKFASEESRMRTQIKNIDEVVGG
jgi:5-methylcytosine-specific restriction endonuclease McrA